MSLVSNCTVCVTLARLNAQGPHPVYLPPYNHNFLYLKQLPLTVTSWQSQGVESTCSDQMLTRDSCKVDSECTSVSSYFPREQSQHSNIQLNILISTKSVQ